ncbi:MAG: PAS domain-containing protein [Nitrospirae bacterium]|nr:PAS domain-containing protein [Nitrospirota bacterium]
MTDKAKKTTSASRYPRLLSLRYGIPLLLVIMTGVSLLYINYMERQRAIKRIHEVVVREMTERSINLQAILEHLLMENRMDLVQEQIGLLGSDIYLRLLLLVDENDNITASSRRKWLGHKVGDVLSEIEGDEKRYFLRDMETTRTNRKASITMIGNHKSIYFQYPVYSRIFGDKQRYLNVKTLFIDYDFAKRMDMAYRALYLSTFNYSVFIIIIYILLGLAIRLMVTRRLTKLTSVVNRVTSGDMAVRAEIGGKDEITNLAAGLNTMLGKIIETQSDLQNSKRELSDMLESIGDGFFTLNREWRYTFLNTNAAKMIKSEVKDLTGKIIWEEYPEAVGTPYFQTYHHVMETGEVTHFEDYYPALDRWYEGTVYPYPDGISIYFRDVTQRKCADEAIFKLQQKLSKHLEQTLFAVIEWDREFRVQYWNPAAEKIFGYTREEAQNRFGPELIIPKGIHAEIDPLWNALLRKTGGSYNTNENITKEGKTIICEWFNTPLTDNKGSVTGVMSFANDITDRKKMEVELYVLTRNLQLRVNEEVEKNRQKDQLMYEQSRQVSMSELLVNIAHHWRQPLASVALLVQDIRDAYLNNELDEEYLTNNVKLTMSELKALSAMIDNFRNFYIQKKELREFNISAEINEADRLISAYVKEKGIIIDKELDESLTAYGYPNEFAHVILNILNNAMDKFERINLTAGIIRIKLYKHNSRNVITIANNGGEIPDDILNNVFDPYFTTKDKSRGTGMGLYMAKMIIEKNMNGSISVRNIDGWCEFRIEI